MIRKPKAEVVKQDCPDFCIAENNAVVAVYVTGPEILKRDNVDLIGIPFIFYDGTTRKSIVEQLKAKGIPYFTGDEYKRLTHNKLEGLLPDSIHVHGREYSWQELIGQRFGPFGGAYVPYSFSIFHNRDIQQEVKVRSSTDYDRMVDEILPEVNKERKKQKQIEVFYSSRLNRILSAITKGAYGPRMID